MGLTSIGRRALALAAPVLLSAATLAAAAPAVAAASGFTPAIGAKPHFRSAGKPAATGSSVVFGCQLPTTTFPCYGPSQIQRAYDIDELYAKGIDGTGRTIVIVDAFQNPYIREELRDFSTVWGLPQANLQIVAPDGLTPFDINDDNMVGWSGEISLDVQWAHAIAPKAKIVLVLAKSNEDADILERADVCREAQPRRCDLDELRRGRAVLRPQARRPGAQAVPAGAGQGHHADRFVG